MSEELTRYNAICKKLDFIRGDIKEISDKADISSQRMIRAETKIEAADLDRKEMKEDSGKIWDHFTIMKEELKKDLKEYIGIVVSGQIAKLKNWVYASSISAAVAIIATAITIIIKFND